MAIITLLGVPAVTIRGLAQFEATLPLDALEGADRHVLAGDDPVLDGLTQAWQNASRW
jgi:hypothetical protein